ncbi:MAG: hypothetical protein ABIJ81_04505 [Patescibacteria group bacterium]
MYLESSKDILNLSIALSVFGLAFLFGWILVYFLIIIRRLVKILQGVEQSMRKLEDFFSAAKEKLEHSASYLSMLAVGAKELVRYFIDKRDKQQSRKRSK